MSWFPKRDRLEPVQASAIDFAVALAGSFYIKGEAETGKSVVLVCIAAVVVCCADWVERSSPGWRRITSGFGAMGSAGRALGVA